MRRVVLRGLLARRTRLALTALAVALGVTLIAGTYVFTDTIDASFARIFSAADAGRDVVLTPQDDLASDDGPPPLPASVVGVVRGVAGVSRVEGSIFDQGGTFLNHAGQPFGTHGPKFVASVHAVAQFGGFSYAQGRAPRTAGEVALDKATADREHLGVGDTLGIQASRPARRYRITGLTQVAGVDSYGGASIALLVLGEAQRITDKVGRLDEVDAAVTRGTSAQDVVRALRRALPSRVTVRTGQQQAASQTSDIRDDLGFLQTALLAFAGISLFVGAFLIFNTFSITVAQRAREFALLRTLGASRGQVLRSVLAEGLVLGVAGSAAGLALGLLVAKGLRALFKAFGFELPGGAEVVAGRTVWVSLVVGVVVTLAASLAPALRATRVPPVAALREGVALPPTRSSRFMTPVALLLTAIGVALMCVGLLAGLGENPSLAFVGAGAAVTFLGVALLSPRLVGPIAAVVGAPIARLFGVTGRLARENTVRQPGRTAVTAAALMIGVALVAFATIFAAGARHTIDKAIDQGLRGDLVLQDQQGFGAFPAEATDAVRHVPGVGQVTGVRFADGRTAAGDKVNVSGIDQRSFGALYDARLPRLAAGEVVAAKGWAADHGAHVGSVLVVTTPTRRTVSLRVVGLVDDKGMLLGDLTVPVAVLQRSFGEAKDTIAIASADGPAKVVRARVSRELKRDFPQVQALTAKEFKDDQSGQVDQVLTLIYALLALAIVVSLFGIVNTLVLSITERTRELGLLRAVGTSRRQVRRMVRLEAVITALIGGVLGLVLGVLLAILVTRTIDDFSLQIPVFSLLALLVAAGAAGVLAAVLPGRRAARLDVLGALAHD